MAIYEGTFYNHDDEFYGQIEINPDTGIIENVSRNTNGKVDVRFSKDYLIFPGFSDIHVHFRESISTPTPNPEELEKILNSDDPTKVNNSFPYLTPEDVNVLKNKNNWKDLSYKEDAQTGSDAAVNGGVVLTMPMPNIDPAPASNFFYYSTQKKLNRTQIPIIHYAAIRPGTEPVLGIVPYKVYMGHSFGNTGFEDLETLDATLEHYRGQHVSFHVEHPLLLEKHKDEDIHQKRRPPECEIEATQPAIDLVRKHGLIGKFCHWSTAMGLDIIQAERAKGLQIELEVTPEHLYFNSDNMNDEEILRTQCNPPIQTRDDQAALLGGLRSGAIDHLATDHAPHLITEKAKGMSGMPSLDTYGPFTTWLMHEHNFIPQDIARIASYNPGKFANKFLHLTQKNYGAGFGKIEEGYYGSLTIINMNKGIKIKNKDLKSKCAWSPFSGLTFPGRVEQVILGGEFVDR